MLSEAPTPAPLPQSELTDRPAQGFGLLQTLQTLQKQKTQRTAHGESAVSVADESADYPDDTACSQDHEHSKPNVPVSSADAITNHAAADFLLACSSRSVRRGAVRDRLSCKEANVVDPRPGSTKSAAPVSIASCLRA